MSSQLIRNEYPRPGMKRELWQNLNGIWEFEFDDKNIGENEGWYLGKTFSKSINVPFVYQSELSGIGIREEHDCIWYRRKFQLITGFMGKRVHLNFGAVDFRTKVWVNGIFQGEHIGGYSPFTFDITESLQDINTVVVKVEDLARDRYQPRGKQRWTPEPYGCWYTGYSGIWQTVWLEAVEEVHLEKVNITPDIDNRRIEIFGRLNSSTEKAAVKATVLFQGKEISTAKIGFSGREFSIFIDVEFGEFEWNGIKLWSPETPNLYDLELLVEKEGRCIDSVKSYFGMRKVSVRDDRFLLNNVPYYQRLLLNQGYYPGGWITPESEKIVIDDIKTIKKLGFNGIRMHQKIEDPIFLYWCDKMGLLVWEEMPSFYRYGKTAIRNFLEEWPDIIERDYNHPSIVAWVPFNESWGVTEIAFDKKQQNTVKAIFYLTKTLDATRVVIDNDGWEHTETDICTIHDYDPEGERLHQKLVNTEKILNGVPSSLFPHFVFAGNHKYNGQPVIVSEYGGIAFIEDSGWGYGDGAKDTKEYIERIRALTEAILRADNVCGYCYTQYTDVEDEKNGLLTEERELKADPGTLRSIFLND